MSLAAGANATNYAVRGALAENGTASQALPSAADALNSVASPMNMAATHSPVGWSGYFQALAVVFGLMGILVLGIWLLKKYGPKGAMGPLQRKDLKIEGQLPLGPKKNVVVVRILNKRLVLGVTDQNINLLTELDNDNDDNSTQNFSTVLEQAGTTDSS